MKPHPALNSRIHGCWLGKSIGGTLGLPAEGKMERLNFSFYNPVPTTALPNDDLELQIVWLHLVENVDVALDASLDHGTVGIADEILFAGMQSAVAAGETPRRRD